MKKDGLRFKGVAKFNLEELCIDKEYIFESDTISTGEAVFIPSNKSNIENSSDAGYLCFFTTEEDKNKNPEETSEFRIINARTMRLQARIKINNRVNNGFHGFYYKEE